MEKLLTFLGAEIHASVQGAFAKLLNVDAGKIVHWSPHRAMYKGIGHVLIRIASDDNNPPIAFDIRDDQQPKHVWLERDGVFFDLRDNDDGTSSNDRPAQADLLPLWRLRSSETMDNETNLDAKLPRLLP